jgi:hypothetical protein
MLQARLLPGCGCYSPLDPVKQAQGAAFSMAGRWPDAVREQQEGPAPGAYELPAGNLSCVVCVLLELCCLCTRLAAGV